MLKKEAIFFQRPKKSSILWQHAIRYLSICMAIKDWCRNSSIGDEVSKNEHQRPHANHNPAHDKLNVDSSTWILVGTDAARIDASFPLTWWRCVSLRTRWASSLLDPSAMPRPLNFGAPQGKIAPRSFFTVGLTRFDAPWWDGKAYKRLNG